MEKIALLFPGQGSQYVGMFKHFYEQYEIARRTFEEADDVLGFDLTKCCMEGSLSELSKIETVLPAILTTSIVAFRIYMKEIGIPPHFLAGHSLGEYSALCCSGAIRFADVLTIVHKRAKLARQIAEKGSGAMVIISNVDVGMISNECKEISNDEKFAMISCYNAAKEVAVSGHAEAVMQIEDKAIEFGAFVTPLIGGPPFHCPLMRPAGEALRKTLIGYNFGPVHWPVVSNVTASVYEGNHQIIDHLTDQIMVPVKWHQTMNYLEEQGVTLSIELGPKNVLSNLFKHASSINKKAFDHEADLIELIASMGKKPEKSNLYNTILSKCLAIAVSTPNNNFDQNHYRQEVLLPYRKMQSMVFELAKSGEAPRRSQAGEAFVLLKKILAAKGIAEEEQAHLYDRVFNEIDGDLGFN